MGNVVQNKSQRPGSPRFPDPFPGAPPSRAARMAAIFKVLGDPTRLSIVSALRDGEMCVCDLAAFLKMTESAVSHHLRRLRDLSLVKNRRDGQVLYYSLDDDHVQALVTMVLDHVRE